MAHSTLHKPHLDPLYLQQPSTSAFKLRRPIQIERRANERQMAKRLRRIPQLLSRPRNLLTKHAQMIAKTQHILENIRRADDILRIVDPGPGQCLDQPKCTHREGALASANAIVGLFGIVAVDQAGGGQAAFFGGEEDGVHGAQETGVVGGDEEDEGGDEDAGVEEVAAFIALDEAPEVWAVAFVHDLFVDLVAECEPLVAVRTGKAAFLG